MATRWRSRSWAGRRTGPAAVLVHGVACLVWWVGVGGAQEPNKVMLEDAVRFTGTASLEALPQELEEIRIGLFAGDAPDDPVSRALVRGASLAVEHANGDGGALGLPLRLVRRWAEDPWSGGAREVVRLVYEDRVWAIVGGPDGSSTHVVQQVATKAHVPLIAPASSDPTLTQVRVPWIFRLPPDDAAQAAELVETGLRPLGATRVGLLSSTDHDARTAALELVSRLHAAGLAPLFHLVLPPPVIDPGSVCRRAVAFRPDALVVRLAPDDTLRLLEACRGVGFDGPVLMPWVPGLDPGELRRRVAGPLAVVDPMPGLREEPAHARFEAEFIRRFGEPPPPEAAFAHHAVDLVVEAVREGGLSRSAVADIIRRGGDRPGLTGRVAWDHGGGSRTRPGLWRTSVPGGG